MKILIINPLDETNLDGKKGGNQRLAEALAHNLRKYTRHTVVEHYTHFNDYTLYNIINAYIENRRIDCSAYDCVITIKFPSYVIRHKNHISLINHRMRQFYDLWPEYKKQFSGWALFKRKVLRLILRVIDTHYLKKTKKIYAQSGVIRKRLLRSGIISEVLYPPETIDGLEKGAYNYLFLPGRLDDERKRVSLVIDAMKLVKGNIKLIISGDGNDKIALHDRAAGDKRIVFMDYVNEPKLIALYKDALAVIFVPAAEDYGLVAIEAMKCAKPVITCSDSGGPTEIVKNFHNGFVCAPTPESIAKSITYLIQHPNEAKRMGKNAFDDGSHIHWKNYIQKILSA